NAPRTSGLVAGHGRRWALCVVVRLGRGAPAELPPRGPGTGAEDAALCDSRGGGAAEATRESSIAQSNPCGTRKVKIERCPAPGILGTRTTAQAMSIPCIVRTPGELALTVQPLADAVETAGYGQQPRCE
ncbi:hypothetical protein C8Q77DRAFT_1143662, partial [Trametes polyzona]